MKTLVTYTLAAFAICAATGLIPSHAKPGDFKAACEADIKKLCVGVEPGEGRIAKCMHANKDKLSEACKAQTKEALTRLQKIGERANRRGANSSADEAAPPAPTL
jgi:hypothetical protein